MRLRPQRHEFLSLGSTVIGLIIGSVAFAQTLDLASGERRSTYAWVVGPLTLLLLGCFIWQWIEGVRARMKSDDEVKESRQVGYQTLGTLDGFSDRSDQQFHVLNKGITKRDLEREAAARKRAGFLTARLSRMLAQYPRPTMPEIDWTAEDAIVSPALGGFVAEGSARDSLILAIYRQEFEAEAIDVAFDLARSGLQDDALLVLVHQVRGGGGAGMFAAHVAERLRAIAETDEA